jgi:hypothetical protein
MGQGGSPASNLMYDLVSIQYHALKGAQVYEQFLNDAGGNDEVKKFIQQVKDEDAKRAQTCHQLLAKLTKDGGISVAA